MKVIFFNIKRNYIFSILLIIIIISFAIGYSYINSELNYTANITMPKYNCTQSNLYDRLACMSTLDSINSKYVSNLFGVNFSSISSDTNGKALYTLSSTIGDTYPVHYYRGAVDNNNVKFAGFCWKIVRTTETGGTKLIYNGEPDGEGHCSNVTGNNTTLGSLKFNLEVNSPAYGYYMYGDIYETQTITYSTIENQGYLFGNSINFVDQNTNISGDGTYTLQSTTSQISEINTHHYTCFNNTGQCSQVSYIYYLNDNVYYINLKDGKNVNGALNDMKKNIVDSNIKEFIDSWYEDHLTTYTNKLEDTIWCCDKTINVDGTDDLKNSGWIPNGGNVHNYLWYYTYYRRVQAYTPKLSCDNKEDAFTVNDTVNGNGALKYPIALITQDETMLAGGNNDADNLSYYLYNGLNYWNLAPIHFTYGKATASRVTDYGKPSGNDVNKPYYVRPAISLNHNQTIQSGNGTASSPYVVE